MDDFNSISILKDDSDGLVELGIVSSHKAKRTFAIQNNIDGRFMPSNLQIVEEVAKCMSEQIGPLQENEIIVGFTEGSVLLAGEIARVRQSPFVCTTKTQKPNNSIIFKEEHRDINSTHNLLAIDKNKNLILIEDEITKGKTILNVCIGLQSAGYKNISVSTLVETVNYKASELIKDRCGIKILSLVQIQLT